MKNSWPQLLPWNKETLYSGKNCSLRLNTITYKQKMFLWNNCSTLGQSFFMSCYFTRVFVHLSVIAAVCYFSVYKWVLLNRAPTSTQLHRPLPSSIYLHPANFNLHPAHFSLHPALCNTPDNIWTKILHLIGQFPEI